VRALAGASSAEAAIDAVLREVGIAHGCAFAAAWSVDPDSGAVRLRRDWASGNEADELRRVSGRLTFPPGVGIVGRALESRDAVIVDDIAAEADFPRGEIALAAGLRAAVAVPLASTEHVIGVMEFISEGPGVPADKIADVEAAAQQLAPYLARLQVEDLLRISEEESASIVQAALDCIITMDHRGEVVGFNPAAESTFGYTREQAIGRPLADLIIPPELRGAHERALAAYVQTGRPTILNRRLELNGMRADGTTFPVELTVTRLGKREPPVFAGFIRDIGEQQRASARLAFLARAGRQMAESMDWQATLRAIVRAAVPAIADGAALTVVEGGGRPVVAAVAGAEPDRVGAAAERVIRSGEVELGEDGRLLVAPLRSPAGVTGALTLTRAAASPRFGHDDVELVTSFAARASLHVQNSRLYTERSHIARTLQASLRPQALPDVPGADIGVRYLPAGEHNEVGGDFYDLYRTGEHAWGALVGDVSGKGAEAAAVTSMARHTLRTASMLHDRPGEILDVLNRGMIAQAVPAFCTVVYARVCPAGDRGLDVTYANGGHPAPVILRAGGELEWFDAGRGPLVGAIPGASFGEGSVRLAPGDLLLLYTDGVTEVRTSDPALGERELAATLTGSRSASAAELVAAVEWRAVEIQDGRPRDDIAVLAIRAT
jgi:PAS domain S-box-containing protein